MQKELNIFIIWDKARYLENKILKDISCRFEILKTFEIKWSEKLFDQNLSRLYGKRLTKTSKKREVCGSGEFLAVIVSDANPKYIDGKNINLTNAKNIYRQWTNYGHKIHGSDNKEETDENLMFLLGMDSKEFMEKYNEKWNGQHIRISQEIVGSPEWYTEEELLNFAQKIPDVSIRKIQDTHLITTKNISKVCRLLNATKRLFFMKRNLYQIPVNGENKFIYIRRQI